MPIINIQDAIRLCHKGNELRIKPVKRIFVAQSLSKYCFYIGIQNPNVISNVIEYIPVEYLQGIKNGVIYLLIGCEFEAAIEMVSLVYEILVIKHHIPEDKIILVSGTPDIKKEIEFCSKKFNLKEMESYYVSCGEYDMHICQINLNEPISNKKKDKKYLLFNRRWRLHRPFIVALLKSYDLLEEGYVSLGHTEDSISWSRTYEMLLDIHKLYKCENTLNQLLNHKEKILNIPDLYVDTSDLIQNRIEFYSDTLSFYESSYFSVVTETEFFTDVRFFSEKIFKPIAHKHPFILVSSPLSLDILKKLGYKSFHPFINEQYDIEKNHSVRMKMIVDEIRRLCNLDDTQWNELLQNINSILEHNYYVLKEKKSIKDYCFKF